MIDKISLINIVFLCLAGFFAAMVDSIAGGGGIISLPAYLLAGIPPHIALGTNKFSSTAGAFTSSRKFIKSGNVNFSIIKYLIPFTLLGSALGVNTVLKINQKYLSTVVLVLILFVGLYTLFSKNIGLRDNLKPVTSYRLFVGILIAFSLGFYDGFFGPGTGSFLIFGLINIFGFNFVRASGNAKVLNFISNFSALVMFGIRGQIYYLIGLPVAICMVAGAHVGTKLALRNGAKFIKPIFVAMSLAVAVKLLFQML